MTSGLSIKKYLTNINKYNLPSNSHCASVYVYANLNGYSSAPSPRQRELLIKEKGSALVVMLSAIKQQMDSKVWIQRMFCCVWLATSLISVIAIPLHVNELKGWLLPVKAKLSFSFLDCRSFLRFLSFAETQESSDNNFKKLFP